MKKGITPADSDEGRKDRADASNYPSTAQKIKFSHKPGVWGNVRIRNVKPQIRESGRVWCPVCQRWFADKRSYLDHATDHGGFLS